MSKAPLLIASLAMAAGSAALEYDGRRRQAKAQDKANNQWLSYQQRANQRARGVEEEERQAAWQRVNETVDANSQANREAAIASGTEEVADRFGNTTGINDILDEGIRGSGQEKGRSGEFDTALAASLNKATGDVRKRLQALAAATGGYGQAGMGGMIEDAFRTGGQDISAINQGRQGNMRILQADRSVQPEMMDYKQSPLVPILQIGSSLAGLGATAGGGAGTNFFGAATQGGPGMTFGNSGALSGMSGAELIPGGGGGKTFSFLNPLRQTKVPWNNNVVQF